MSNGHTGVPKEVYEISPDDNNDWRKRLTYSKSFAGTMREDVNGDWVKVCDGRYQRIHVVGGSKSGVTNMWEYVKGSEADFEGAPEWATHKIKRPFATNFVNGVDVGCIGVTIENPNQQPWPLNVSVNMLIIAERRKVDNLQTRVNDANLGDALKEMFRDAPSDAVYDKYNRPCKGVTIDVYDVLVAFNVTNPALQHLIKKALAVGQRGHKDKNEDLNEILASAKRAIELEKRYK